MLAAALPYLRAQGAIDAGPAAVIGFSVRTLSSASWYPRTLETVIAPYWREYLR